MKKIIKYILLTVLMFLPFCVSAKDTVKITNVKMEEMSDYTEEISDATFDGLNINFNVRFTLEKDYIIYKVTLKNEDSEDYELTDTNDFSASKYIEYKVEYTGGKIIKANSTKEATITITYAHEVPSDKFVNGRFEEPNKFSISLSNNKRITNPKTGGILIVVGAIVGLLLTITIIAIKGNTRTKLLSILFGVLLLPISVFALTKITITVNSKVLIEREAEFCVMAYDSDDQKYNNNYIKFEPGMTWDEYYDSELNTYFHKSTVIHHRVDLENAQYYVPSMFASHEYIACRNQYPPMRALDSCGQFFHEEVTGTSLVRPKSQGCYITNYFDGEE